MGTKNGKTQRSIDDLAKSASLSCSWLVQHVDDSRIDEQPIMDGDDYDNADRIYDRLATILNATGMTASVRAYVIAQLCMFGLAMPAEDIPLSEEF